MKNNILIIFCVLMLSLLFSCSKKSIPKNTATNDGATVRKTAAISRTKMPVPESIVVNDAVAKKTVEGRYYYDLNGKRYYRNNKDGKYYLFNKSMYSNPDFNAIP